MRKAIFWLHLGAGVLAGTVILIMSFTGVVLMYERQVLEWADRAERRLPPPDAPRLSLETLVSKAQEAEPEIPPSSITLRADPNEPVTVSFGRGRSVLLDPYRGDVLAPRSIRLRAFFRAVTDWHRWLGASRENRDTARAITGACNLVFLFIVASGFYLWWPRNWSPKMLRGVVWFQRDLRDRARDFNWHNTIGFWSAAPLFVIVLSAVFISYPWANDLLYRVTGYDPPSRSGAPREEKSPAPASSAGLDRGWPGVEARARGWKSITVRLVNEATEDWVFQIDRGNGARPDLRSQLTLDRTTGAVVRDESFSEQELPRRIRSWMRWLHTGEAGGFLGQTLAGLVSAGATVLVWTGLALAWRRARAALRRPRESRVGRAGAKPSNAYHL